MIILSEIRLPLNRFLTLIIQQNEKEKPNQDHICIYAAKEDQNRLLFGLCVSGVMSNTILTETFMPLGKINCTEGELTSKDDCLEWKGAVMPVDEADIVKDVNRWPILFLITCWLFCPALFSFKLFQNYCGICVNSIGAERLALATNDYSLTG